MPEWNYAKEQCEANAKAEGVADRITFHKGDAAHLEDPDETFDATVSNFVFHEVRSAKDKRDVVREALRIVKRAVPSPFRTCSPKNHSMVTWKNLSKS